MYSLQVCEKIFYDFSLEKLGSIQAELKVYNSTDMNVIGSSIMYANETKPLQAFTLIVTDIEGSVKFSSEDCVALR